MGEVRVGVRAGVGGGGEKKKKKGGEVSLYDVVLSSTILYPEGGGQPCDVGGSASPPFPPSPPHTRARARKSYVTRPVAIP